jgi:diguanylate cyclase (GGDEF)-like protein
MEARGSTPREADLGDSRWEALEATLPLVYVAEFDRAGTLRYISGVVQQWTGHAPEGFLGDVGLWYDCIHPNDVDRVRDAEQRLFDIKEQLNLEYRIVGPDGEARWVWERNTIVRDGRGAPICTHGTIVDLSRFGGEELDARGVGVHTPLLIRRNFLTGLPSRQVLSEHLELALARAQREGRVVALLDIDLDRFRAVNDAVGHSGGDIVLTQVASRLREHVPAGDLLLHSGGDEFILMLCGLEAELAETFVEDMAARISEALSTPFEVAGRQLEVRASIGYALGPDDGRDPDECSGRRMPLSTRPRWPAAASFVAISREWRTRYGACLSITGCAARSSATPSSPTSSPSSSSPAAPSVPPRRSCAGRPVTATYCCPSGSCRQPRRAR